MTSLERAHTYAAIFVKAGDSWRNFVPVDATVKGDDVYIQGVKLDPYEDGWRLTENGKSWAVCRAAVQA